MKPPYKCQVFYPIISSLPCKSCLSLSLSAGVLYIPTHCPGDQLSGLLTKDGVAPGGVSTERENVGMVGSNHSQRVFLGSHGARLSDGLVHLHCLMQRLLGLTLMVPVVNPAS